METKRKNRAAFYVLLILLLIIVSPGSIFANNRKSAFNNLEGIYSGSVSGVLFVKTGDSESTENPLTVLDFQKGRAQLSVTHDENEIYDTHFENYTGYTSNGKLAVKYSTYSNANGLWINIGENTYQISTIDGACEFPVDGIKVIYQAYGNVEYLVISFSKELLLNDYWPMFHEKKSKGQTYPPYQEAPKKYACIMPGSSLVFVIDNICINDSVFNVIVGVMEDDREELANWKKGPSKNRVIRPLFGKKGTGWIPSTRHPEKMKWIISFNGENAGAVESIPKTPKYNTSLTWDLHTPEIAPGQKLVMGKPSHLYSGWQNTSFNRPLVLVSKENYSDPERWIPFQPEDNQINFFKSVFHREYPVVKNCDDLEVLREDPWEYGDEKIIMSDRAYRSNRGDMLVSMRLEGCKCGVSFGPFEYQLFLIKADKSARHIGLTGRLNDESRNLVLSLVDAGDYDADGQSEVVFFVSGYNEDGYALFYDSFQKKVVYTWSYH